MRHPALLVLLLLAALTSPGAAGAAPATAVLPPAADVGLPFWCDWSYDWESRCYRDDGPRLPLGGAGDKVWRSSLRFSLDSIPEEATITRAELRLRYDGVCVAPRRALAACRPPGAVVDAHRLLSTSLGEREPELDERVLWTAVVFESSEPQWLVWDLTALVGSWHRRLAPNHGVLLKIQDGDEDLAVPGPALPSAGHPEAAARPRLVVTYTL
jgi:hypothetical protein